MKIPLKSKTYLLFDNELIRVVYKAVLSFFPQFLYITLLVVFRYNRRLQCASLYSKCCPFLFLNEQDTDNCRPSGIITFPDGKSNSFSITHLFLYFIQRRAL